MNISDKQQRKKTFLGSFISNPKEEKRVFFSIIAMFLIIIVGIIYVHTVVAYEISHPTKMPLPPNVHIDKNNLDVKFRPSEEGNLGSLARIAFFFSVSLFPIIYLMKSSFVSNPLKKGLRFLAKIARSWHVPIAIIGISLVTLHVYIALFQGWEWSLIYISGILSYLILFVLIYYGWKRFRRKDKHFHLYFGIGFVFLFILHTFL